MKQRNAYQRALKLKGSKQTRGIANWCLGIIYNKQGKFLEAETYSKEAVSLLPEAAWTHRRLGDIYTQRGKLKEAIAAYETAIQLNPELAEPIEGLDAQHSCKTNQRPRFNIIKRYST